MEKTKETAEPKSPANKPEKPARKTPARKTARKSKNPDEPPKVIYHCSFCRQSTNETKRLIAGPNGIFICEECVLVCVKIFSYDAPKEWQDFLIKIIADPESKKDNPPENEQNQPQTKKAGKSNAKK